MHTHAADKDRELSKVLYILLVFKYLHCSRGGNLLISEQEDEGCDATKNHQGTEADNIK